MAFGVYVHVPWCASVCGYCDFNTYVPGRLSASPGTYADTAIAEIALMPDRLADTVFVGGGTPTLLAAGDLARVLGALRLAPGAEVTVEANPETVDEAAFARLREAGVTRVSIGMQSAVPHVLAALDRAHTPGSTERAFAAARAAGFDDVSVDLIYGTPAETDADWDATLDAALALEPEHVSAYALTVEPGTRLHAAVRAGRAPAPDEDALARRYERAEARLAAAGLEWYELSSWARDGKRCRHNEGYWRGDDWWAIGPGAHGHVDGERFWTHRHPATHAAAVARGERPIAGRERLDPAQRDLERLMLGIRRREGIALDARRRTRAARLHGLVDVTGDRATLTLRGRSVADAVTRALA